MRKFFNFDFANMDAKTRVFILLSTLTSIVFTGVTVYRYFESNKNPAGTSKIAAAPSGLQSVPGGQLSPEYYRALMDANTQAAQQAQVTGTSAVPTLINTQGQQPALSTTSTATGSCTVMCPGDDAADVAGDINDLVKMGKLSQDDANNLLALAAKNVSVDEYAAALDELVKEGKLTPEEARRLLEKYKKQHENALVAENARGMDALIKAGKLSVDTANDLLDLQRKHVSPADYAAELDRLVKEGKISPELATALLAAYTHQQANELDKIAAAKLQRMAKLGQISADAAETLVSLVKRHVPVNQFASALSRLVTEGKMTPALAAKLLEAYKKQRAALVVGNSLRTLSSQGGLAAEEARRLQALQDQNATSADYLAELKKAVQSGAITPEMAAALLKEYQKTQAALTNTNGMMPVDSSIMGAEDFARLQQRLQTLPDSQSAGLSANSQQFIAAQAQAIAEEAQKRDQSVQEMAGLMSTQAQSLITAAWLPPSMAHVESKPVAKYADGLSGIGKDANDKMPILKPALIKAGTIIFAVLDTAVNSDDPNAPVMATVVEGRFKGAKLLGKLSLANSQDKVSLSFNLMDMDNWPSGKAITAFAIDPDTARTALANSVDYHYLLRYSAVFASSFLSGYANAITNAGTSTTGILGTTTTKNPLSPAQQIAAGLGQVGTTLSAAAGKYFNTPNTVKVNAGVGLGILFMNEVVS